VEQLNVGDVHRGAADIVNSMDEPLILACVGKDISRTGRLRARLQLLQTYGW